MSLFVSDILCMLKSSLNNRSPVRLDGSISYRSHGNPSAL